MDNIVLTSLAFLMVQAIPAPADGLAQTPARGAADPKARNADKQICRSYPATTGSRMGKRRICKTQAEWNLLRDDQQNIMLDPQRNNPGRSGG